MKSNAVEIVSEHRIIPSPRRQLSIGERMKILDASLELYTDAIERCNAAQISNLATKIGVYSATLREDITTKGDTSLKSLVDLNLIEKGFKNQHDRLMDGHCKCKTKGLLSIF